MECKHHHLAAKTNFKMHPTTGRLMLAVFWNSQGLLLERYQERGYYGDMLCVRLKPAVQSKRRGLLSEGVLYLSSHHIVETKIGGIGASPI
jgi:hypothetical protein